MWLFITVSLHLAELTGSEATVRELEMNQTPLLKPVWGIWQISQAGVKCWHVLIALLPTLKPIKPQMMFGVLDCLLEGTSPAVTPFHTELGLILGHVILLTSRSLNSSHTACTGGDGNLWEQTFVLDYGQGFLGQFVHKSGFFFFQMFVALELAVKLETPPTGWLSLIMSLFHVYVFKSSCERDQE